ncbi:hypothetical protein SAMN02745124_04416, partial [Desulfofustis glycolicus DSM 9705]
MFEVTFDMIWSSLKGLHKRPRFLCQIVTISGRQTGPYSLLEIPVQVFIRVVFRRIRRQIKNFYLVLMFRKPFPHDLAVMNPKVI